MATVATAADSLCSNHDQLEEEAAASSSSPFSLYAVNSEERRTEAVRNTDQKLAPRKTFQTSRGFSLIELLIVVAIILVLAAIAVPNLIRSKISANEASTVENMRTVTTANVVYSTTYDIGYAAALLNLGPPAGNNPPTSNAADLIDSLLASGTKSGYIYTYVAGAPGSDGTINSYTLNTDPISPNFTGIRHFFVDESGVIRFNTSNVAGPSDPAIQ
jgi:type IV pilus assembly protein PilA